MMTTKMMSTTVGTVENTSISTVADVLNVSAKIMRQGGSMTTRLTEAAFC